MFALVVFILTYSHCASVLNTAIFAGEFECLNSTTPPGRAFILKLKFCNVDGSKYPFLVFGGHDSKIHIMTAKELGKYVPTAVLIGHEDWVVALDFMKEGEKFDCVKNII